MASVYLRRTQSTPTDNNLYTFSCWVKRGNLGSVQALLGSFTDSSNRGQLEFTSSNQLNYYENLSGSTSAQVTTTQVFRDTSAWYHIVLNVDLDQATDSDRIKIYVNGTQITSFSTATYPSQGATSVIANCTASNGLLVGGSTSDYSTIYTIDGSMSHIHLIDGTAYDASTFGSTDSTTGEWTINTSPSVTYGTNGFFILKDGNSVTDQSGNSNNFTVSDGTLTNTEDSPSNVFATLNPLVKSGNSLTNGNLTVTQNSGTNYQNSVSTLAVTKGKWYAECKLSTISGLFPGVGIIDVSEKCASDGDDNGYFGTTNNPKGVQLFAGGYYSTGNNNNASLTSNSTNDIIGIALDLDSATKNIKMYRNGTLITGSSVTPPDPDGGYAFGVTLYSTSSGAVAEWNFGNGYFGTTAVASAGTNASGNGIFEYDCPDGYTALSTKGLNL